MMAYMGFYVFFYLALLYFSSSAEQGVFLFRQWNTTLQKSGEPVSVSLLQLQNNRYRIETRFFDRKCDDPVADSKFHELSKDESTDLKIRETLGRDSIYAIIEGPTLDGFDLLLDRCHVYKKEFSIHLSGAFHMKVARIRKDYAGANENINAFPLISYEYLVSEWIEFSAKDAILEQACDHHQIGIWTHQGSHYSLLRKGQPFESDNNITNTTNTFATVDIASSLYSSIPYHRSDGYSRGIDLLESYVDVGLHHREVGCIETVDNYLWRPLPGCSWNSISKDEGSRVLSGKKIAIFGDSHARELVFSFITRGICEEGQGEHIKLFSSASIHEKDIKITYYSNSTKCAGLHLHWIYDEFCDLKGDCGCVEAEQFKSYDLVLRNCGHHPASMDHWTLDRYISKVDSMFKKYLEMGFTNKNLVWIESVPQPLRQDHWVLEVKDWRTLQRLRLYNSFSNQLFQSNNFTVIWTYPGLMPFVDSMCDFAHYIGYHVEQPIIQQILHFLKKKDLESLHSTASRRRHRLRSRH